MTAKAALAQHRAAKMHYHMIELHICPYVSKSASLGLYHRLTARCHGRRTFMKAVYNPELHDS